MLITIGMHRELQGMYNKNVDSLNAPNKQSKNAFNSK